MQRSTVAMIITASAAAIGIAFAGWPFDPIRSGATLVGGALGIAFGRVVAPCLGRLMRPGYDARAEHASMAGRRPSASPTRPAGASTGEG